MDDGRQPQQLLRLPRLAGHGPCRSRTSSGKARLIVLPFARFGWIAAINPQSGSAGRRHRAPASPVWAARSRLVAAAAAVRRRRRPACSTRRRRHLAPAAGPTNPAATRLDPMSRYAASRRRAVRAATSDLPPRSASCRSARSCAAAGNWTLQATLHRHGLGPVAGVDEAGRGACAGPLVVAACVLRPADAQAARRPHRLQAAHARCARGVLRADRRARRPYSVVVIPPDGGRPARRARRQHRGDAPGRRRSRRRRPATC